MLTHFKDKSVSESITYKTIAVSVSLTAIILLYMDFASILSSSFSVNFVSSSKTSDTFLC